MVLWQLISVADVERVSLITDDNTDGIFHDVYIGDDRDVIGDVEYYRNNKDRGIKAFYITDEHTLTVELI